MRLLCAAFSIIVIGLCQIGSIHCQCIDVNKINGVSDGVSVISDSKNMHRSSSYYKCWKIEAPYDHFIRLHVQSLGFSSQNCNTNYLRIRIAINDTIENHRFCPTDINKNVVVALHDIIIEIASRNDHHYDRTTSVTVNYEILQLKCASKDSFHCTNNTCISKSQVCDGVKNCVNGADELGCETGIVSVPGVEEARLEAIAWLKSKRTSTWGWRENTARAVTALFLTNTASFNGTNLEDELMAKQTELRTSVALLKNPLLSEELSSFINALLATCHSPRYFYGQDLVKHLKSQVSLSAGSTHPITYLALCNANETWPDTADEDLSKILRANSEYPFVMDIQAFALMAISCYKNNAHLFSKHLKNTTLMNEYEKTVKRFKNHQLPDGSFGNIHTTALVTQALISGGQEHVTDWKLNATIKYLIKELNSSKKEMYGYYLALPVLSGKSLADIAKIDCTANPRKHKDDDLVDDVNDYTGTKMRVRYSLFVGDRKDIIHTISLRVPEHFTAYQLMRLAEEEDQKYKFEWKRVSNKVYVYSIGGLTNDPESGKFWLLYMESTDLKNTFKHYIKSPEEIILEDEAHFVMWYKRVEI